MTVVVPMAGLGSRFSKEGYILPKPLIPVSGVPMISKVVDDLPNADTWIFIVRKEHVINFSIDIYLKSLIPDAIVISIDYTTEGQACTCLLAREYIDQNDSLLITACDTGFIYDAEKFNELVSDKSVDSIYWTFTKNILLKDNPKAYGWCCLGRDRLTIEDMSVKEPISDDPYNDHAIVATFYFKKAKDFLDATSLMIERDFRINNEFYVDSLPFFLRELGKRTVIFDVDELFSWGTPKALYVYQEIDYKIALMKDMKMSVPYSRKVLDYFSKERIVNE